MPITRIKSEELLLKRLKPKLLKRYSADMVIHGFSLLRRKKQIDLAKKGDEALRREIKNVEQLEQKSRLKITCFFSSLSGGFELLGMLASYVDKNRSHQLWWEPEKGD